MDDGRVNLVSKVDVGHGPPQAQRAPTGRTTDITGLVALDSATSAATAARAWRRSVIDRPISPAEFRAASAHTEDTWWTHTYSSLFASIRQQRWNHVTSDLHSLHEGNRGRTPQESDTWRALFPQGL